MTLSAVVACMAAIFASQPQTQTSLPRGRVIERVECRLAPSQSYALYLPTAYDPDRGWPVLVVMDPRGRARHALDLFREPAEQLGWVVASSYDTRSDESLAPNKKSLEAMFPDLLERVAVDRVYLTGFSGTSRIAWVVAHTMAPAIAGVIGVGGGMTGDGLEPKPKMPFSYFGVAGTRDFNFQEMRELERRMRKVGASHRFVYFDGRHSWPPPAVCTQALEWMEIDAMRRELRTKDEELIARLLRRRLREAATQASTGEPYWAQREYESIARDFVGLHDVAGARARATELAATAEVKLTRSKLNKLSGKERSFKKRLTTELSALRQQQPPFPPVGRFIGKLKLDELKQHVDRKQELEAQSAARSLELALVRTGFYLPRELMARKQYARALVALEIAAYLKPQSPRVAYLMAQAEAARGREERALVALERAVALGFRSRASIESEPRFEHLRASPRFRAVLDGLR